MSASAGAPAELPREQTALSQRIAEFACALDYDALPERLREFARYHVLDTVGTALAATQFDFARCAYAGLLPLAEGGNSSIIGMQTKLGLRDAVLMNGILAHGLDYDDTHTGAQVHPSVSALPCALGLAEFLDKSGRDLLTAYVLGAEIATRVGLAANNTMQLIGFHPTGVVGHLGCAVAAGKLYGLNAEQMAMAQGLAGSTASALAEYRTDASWNKRMHAGWAAVGGITSASLARGGYIGSNKIYEGNDGLFRSHAGSKLDSVKPDALIDGLGSTWHCEDAAIKPLPVCHLLHACVDSAIALKREHALEADDITSVRVLLHPDSFRIVCEPPAMRRKPASENMAQFSAHFVVAAALTRGRVSFAELSPEALSDPTILDLAQRVTHDVYPDSKFPKYLSGGVALTTRDGRTLQHMEPINRGNGERALTATDIVAKFMDNALTAMPLAKAESARDMLLAFDKVSARELCAVLTKCD